MSIFAYVFEDSPVRLWGLESSRRLRRQAKALAGVEFIETLEQVPEGGRVLLLNGNYLFEIRTLEELVKRPDTVFEYPGGERPAAALVEAAVLGEALNYMQGESPDRPSGLEIIHPEEISAFSEALRSASAPLLEPITQARKPQLESLLYGNAYRGITDLVTKFLWPRPARKLVQWCARLGLSPNMVTTIGLLLVLLACWAFLNGHYLTGLTAGWVMTLLDTVDGKLARVTVQSTPFGNVYDHGIDLLHPPFWYVFWGMSLVGFQPFLGLGQEQMYWMIVVGYVAGRVVEGLFSLLGNCSIFTWRPFDAWFRLITARRNPCLILLTLCAVIGRPDWGFIAVTWWTVLTTLVLVFRLAQGVITRLSSGPLESWLSAADVATGPNASAYRVFGATRGAYGSE
jgi:phosphatidylglycerophosphate synthase